MDRQTGSGDEGSAANSAVEDVENQPDNGRETAGGGVPEERHTIDIPDGWNRLSQTEEIWLDSKKKEVIAGGYVCLNQGGLEMFICPAGTKEHESVIAVNCKASHVHAALMALGAQPGHPVRWDPAYEVAEGPKIEIEVLWKEGEELVRRNGKELVRSFDTRKELDVDWVFGGSLIETYEDGTRFYYGDGGELVCVSNFGTATMDLPIESSQANDSLLFEANTDKLPPVDTKVYVIFRPEISEKKSPAENAEKGPEEGDSQGGSAGESDPSGAETGDDGL